MGCYERVCLCVLNLKHCVSQPIVPHKDFRAFFFRVRAERIGTFDEEEIVSRGQSTHINTGAHHRPLLERQSEVNEQIVWPA